MKRTLAALAFFLAAGHAWAESTVTAKQGPGSSTAQAPWRMLTTGLTFGRTSMVAVTNAAGGTATPTTGLASRKAIEISNAGPNAIWCTIDGTAPVVLTNGRKIATDSSWSLDVTEAVVVTCIAATAAQACATGCTTVSELR